MTIKGRASFLSQLDLRLTAAGREPRQKTTTLPKRFTFWRSGKFACPACTPPTVSPSVMGDGVLPETYKYKYK